MRNTRIIVAFSLALLTLGLTATAYFTRDTWRPWLPGKKAAPTEDDHHAHAHGDRIKLSPEARDNLKLEVKPAKLQNYWRTIQVPGVVVDKPGVSDRGVTAPVAGVVTKVQNYPGNTVKPGEALFTLRLISEYLQNTQAELFKAAEERKVVLDKKDRIKDAVRSGAIAESQRIELDTQLRRHETQIQAYRQDLIVRGLTPEQVDGVVKGTYVKEVVISAPTPDADAPGLVSPTTLPQGGKEADFAYEVKELKVQLGEQVQAGQTLGVLANHRTLYIEGRGFKKEAPLLEKAAQNGWEVEVEFTEDDPSAWPPLSQSYQIRHLANTIDTESRTFGFYIPLVNQSRAYGKGGNTFLAWRFRPGQRVRLHVPVEQFKDVIVLPAGAVVREGPDAFVFRQNGDVFDRKPIRLQFEDRRNVVVANDGKLSPGLYVVQNSAAALNRVLKAQQSAGEGGHGHDHAGHSH